MNINIADNSEYIINEFREEIRKTGKLTDYNVSIFSDYKEFKVKFKNCILDENNLRILIDKLVKIFSEASSISTTTSNELEQKWEWSKITQDLQSCLYRLELMRKISYIHKKNMKKIEIARDSEFSETHGYLLEEFRIKFLLLDRNLEKIIYKDLLRIYDEEQNLSTIMLDSLWTNLNFEQQMKILPDKIEDLMEKPVFVSNCLVSWEATSSGKNALHLAAMFENLTYIILISNKWGADNFKTLLNSYDDDQLTPLYYAILNERVANTKFLIKKDADVNIKDPKGNPLLHLAIDRGNLEILAACLSASNIDLLAKNIFGETALHLACKKINNPQILNLLLNQPGIRENLHVRDVYGNTPFDIALQQKNDEAIKLLIGDDKIDPCIIPDYGKLPADISQDNIIKQLRKYLLLRNLDVDSISNKGICKGQAFLARYYPDYYELMRLIAEWDGEDNSLNNRECVKKLSGNYQDFEELIKQIENDIIWFQVYSDEDLSKINLLSQFHRAEMYEIVKKDSNSCLQVNVPRLVTLPKVQDIEELLKIYSLQEEGTVIEFGRGNHATSARIQKDGSIKYFDSNMPFELKPFYDLHELAQFIEITKYKLITTEDRLLETTCYQFVDSRDKETLTINSNSQEDRCEQILTLFNDFRSPSPNGFTPLHIAVLTKNIPLSKKYLKDNSLINKKDSCRMTPLLYAVGIPGNEEIIKTLLEQENIDLSQAIIEAVSSRNVRAVELLINSKKEFDINEKDAFDSVQQSPLMVAIKNNDHRMIKLLLANGADLTQRNLEGHHCVDYVRLYGSLDTSQLILDHMKEINRRVSY